jgi:hypothetical protein
MMFTPGAVMSGFRAKSPIRGPRPEKPASTFCLSTAPTVMASLAAPGLVIVCVEGPKLPAAIVNRTPSSCVSWFTAWETGSVPSVIPACRLIEITSAPLVAAHCMPAMTHDSWPLPVLSSTLPFISSAPGATPLRRPFEAAPLPTTVSATCVPCPLPSDAVASGVKFASATTLPCRSG